MRSVPSKHVLVVVTRPAVDPHPEGRGAAQRPPPRGEKAPPPERAREGEPQQEGKGKGAPRGTRRPQPHPGGKGGATQGRGATKVRMPVRQAKPQPTIDIELAPDHQHAPSAVKPTLGIKL